MRFLFFAVNVLSFCLSSGITTTPAQNLVDFYVTVLNDKGQMIKGMTATNFRIFENEKPREVKFFSADNESASVAIIFDLSTSVTHNATDSSKNRITWFRKAAVDLIGLMGSNNEFTISTFGRDISYLAELAEPGKAIEVLADDSKFARPKNDDVTPLFVAIKSAIDKLQSSKIKRHVIIVMTDGYDNASSRKVKTDVDVAVRSSLIPIFTVAAYDTTVQVFNPAGMPEPRIASVSNDSGGKYFLALSETDSRNMMMRIATIIQNQYHLGFIPESPVDSSKPRNLEVKLEIDQSETKVFQRPRPVFGKRYIPSITLISNH